MQIYSWNMLYLNAELDRAFDFVSKSDFDIFCLQEVPEQFLKRLQTLPFAIASRIDVEQIYNDHIKHNFNVILTKHSITNQDEITFPEYWHLLPLRTRIWIHFMSSKIFTRIQNRGSVLADISVRGQIVRVINLHTILAHPAWRLKEFELAMMKRDESLPTIVCGDFNVLEKLHITPLNWVLGGTISDALLHRRERTTIENQFVAHELHNPLRGKITHRITRSQLDHILLSKSFEVKTAAVLKDRFGSDHNPIFVETT